MAARTGRADGLIAASRRAGPAPTCVAGLLLMLVLAPHLAAQFVAPEGSDFHNGSSFVDQDAGAAGVWLARLDEALLLGDRNGALDALAALRRSPTPDLVPFGPRTWVPALDLATRRVVERGDDRLRADLLAAERQAIEAARASRDLAELLDRATRTPVLETSAEAAWIAARLLFEQGRWWDAAGLVGRLPATAERERLIAAAEAEQLDERVPPSLGPWNGVQTLTLPLDAYGRAEALPLIIDGRPGETLVFSHASLQGFDLGASQLTLQRTFPDLIWLTAYLRKQGFGPAPPAPRRYSLVRRGGRVVLPFNVAADGWRGPEGRREARLLAVDLDDGSLAWDARLPEPGGSSAFGPPVLAGDRVLCPVFRVGLQAQVSLAAFALADGRLLFDTPLVLGTDVRRFASRRAQLDIDTIDKRAREGTLAVADGIATVCTGFGAVAAVDLLTGRVRHGFLYDRRFAQERAVHHPAFLFDTGGWNHEPVRLWGERVVVAPSDSRFLYMLAREPGPQGQLILEDPIERMDRGDVVTLLPDPGGSDAPAVLATRRRDERSSLVLIGPDGHTLATSPPLPAGEPFTGRPLLVGGVVVVPTELGLRLFAAEDLSLPPRLVPHMDQLPAPREVLPLASGLMILHPQPRGTLYAVHWLQMK